MEYEVIFDLVEEGYQSWRFATYGLPFVVLGVLLVLFPRLIGLITFGRIVSRRFSKLVLGFSISWVILAFAITYAKYTSLQRDLAEGRYDVAQGEISHFVAKNVLGSGTRMLNFQVNGTDFSLNNIESQFGFNQLWSRADLLGNGVNVRISYVGAKIIRFEIGR